MYIDVLDNLVEPTNSKGKPDGLLGELPKIEFHEAINKSLSKAAT
jgi:hypothetical protein